MPPAGDDEDRERLVTATRGLSQRQRFAERVNGKLLSLLRIEADDLNEQPRCGGPIAPSPGRSATESVELKSVTEHAVTVVVSSTPAERDEVSHAAVTPASTSVSFPTKTPLSILREVVDLAVPTSSTYLLIFLNQTVTLMFVGHQLGVDRLAGYALGQSVYNVLGLSIALGLAGAIDTLGSQAFGRCPTGSEVAREVQRGLYICVASCAPLIVLFWTCRPFLQVVFGAELGEHAAEFLRVAPLPLLIITVNVCLTRAFQAQRLPEVTLRATLVSGASCPLFNYFLTHRGISFGVVAFALSLLVETGMLVFQGLRHPRSIIFKCRYPVADSTILSRSSVFEYLRLGVPMMISGVSEWWAFEVQYVVAAQLSAREVAALNVCFSMLVMCIAIPIGNSCAAGTFTGNYLGSGQPRVARVYLKLVALWSIFCATTVATLIFFFGNAVARLYTNEEPALEELYKLMPLLAAFHFVDSLQSTAQGVFRGAGKQSQMTRVMLVCLWLIETPLSAALALRTPLRIIGVIIGFVIGYIVVLPWLLRLAMGWDWNALADEASRTAIPDVVTSTSPATDPHSHGCGRRSPGSEVSNASFTSVPPTPPSQMVTTFPSFPVFNAQPFPTVIDERQLVRHFVLPPSAAANNTTKRARTPQPMVASVGHEDDEEMTVAHSEELWSIHRRTNIGPTQPPQ